MVKHGGGVRCKLAGCNRIAIGKVQLCKAHGRTITALLPLDVGAFTTTTIVAASTVSSVLTTASSAASSLLSSRTTQYAPSTTRRSAAVVASAVDKDESAASEEEDEDNDIINFDDEKEQQEHRRSATATNSYDKFATGTITHNSDTNVNGRGMALPPAATTKHQAMVFPADAATDADADSFVNGKKGKDSTAVSSTCNGTAPAPITVQYMENNNKGRMIASSSPFDLESNNPTLLVAPTKAAAVVATSSVQLRFPSKLYLVLDQCEYYHHEQQKNNNHNQEAILPPPISWLPDGKSFKIHDKERFATEIMPSFFGTQSFKTFQRNLNLWDFTWISKGPHKDVCSHPLFLKGFPSICQSMKRIVLKGTGRGNRAPLGGVAAASTSASVSSKFYAARKRGSTTDASRSPAAVVIGLAATTDRTIIVNTRTKKLKTKTSTNKEETESADADLKPHHSDKDASAASEGVFCILEDK